MSYKNNGKFSWLKFFFFVDLVFATIVATINAEHIDVTKTTVTWASLIVDGLFWWVVGFIVSFIGGGMFLFSCFALGMLAIIFWGGARGRY